MERNGRVAVVGVLLVGAMLLLALAEPCRADVIARRVRRQSPWLQRVPITYALGKKFARNRPAVSSTLALETNTDWPEKSRPAKPALASLELSAEMADSKPAPRSRAFYSCMSNCLTLSQYNPVCGTDHTTYHNQYKLECANRCGAKPTRNRPAVSSTLALETNTDWPEKSRPAKPALASLELSAEMADSKPAPRSRAFYSCMSNCLTLSQYNPVCGTDHTTYHNQYKLECANRCGAKPRVSIKKSGIC